MICCHRIWASNSGLAEYKSAGSFIALERPTHIHMSPGLWFPENTKLVFLFLAGLMGGAGDQTVVRRARRAGVRPNQAARSWSWPKTLRPCSVSPNHVLQFDAGPVTRHSGGKRPIPSKVLGVDLFGRPSLDESDCRRALAHVWSPCMEESMRRWAASMQIKNRAASLLHTCQPASCACPGGGTPRAGCLETTDNSLRVCLCTSSRAFPVGRFP